MGSMAARDMVAHAANRDMALGWHLSHNHYPPLPDGSVAVANQALAAIAEGEPERTIDIADIGSHRRYGTDVPAYVIAESWHLDAFIEAALSDGEDC